ncbi:MAG: glycosyltransferase family 4 protein [Anaerolineae bacterium]|nr:glycosyltransferase family 4 protein [Anaerolineae bacterium]
MNILFPYLARWRSANWSRYHQLLGALCRQGHRVYVLEAPRRPDSQETNYADVEVPLPEGMVVREVSSPLWRLRLPLEKLAKKGLVTLATWGLVREAIGEWRIDVLLLYNFPQLVLANAARGRCRVVFDVADDLVAMFAHEAGRWAPALCPLAEWAFRRLVQRSDLVTTASSLLARTLPKPARVLPNGADLAAAAAANGKDIRAQYRPPIVGFVGAFEYFVDFDLVLDAAALLPEATFLLVGDGRERSRVNEEVRKRGLANVALTGAVPYPRNLDYVQAMDIGLVPLRGGAVGDGAAPLKLFEYAALGKPIVSTPLSETQSVAGDFVSVARDAEEAAGLIRHVISEPGAFEERARLGAERVRTTYNWDRIARSFVDLVGSAR